MTGSGSPIGSVTFLGGAGTVTGSKYLARRGAGGTGVLAGDARTETGLTAVQLSPRLQSEISTLLWPVAAVANPEDAGATAILATPFSGGPPHVRHEAFRDRG